SRAGGAAARSRATTATSARRARRTGSGTGRAHAAAARARLRAGAARRPPRRSDGRAARRWRAMTPMRVAVVLAAFASAAVADPPRDPAPLATADEHHRRGSMLFDLGDYAGAIAEFQAGFVLTNAPGFLYNLGQAYRLAGDCARAEHAYRAY